MLFALASVIFGSPIIPVVQDRVKSTTGDVRRHEEFESKILGNKRTIQVFLPEGYDAKREKPYPVIYFCDGQNVFDGATSFIPNQEWRADETATALIKAKMIPPVILVAVDNGGMKRSDEYLPTKAKFQGTEIGGDADKFGDFLVKEVKPFIAGKYHVSARASETGLIGSSFGGIISFYLGTMRPEEFGLLGVMSPSFWWDGESLTKQVPKWVKKPAVRIWMDMGLEEGPSMVGPGREMETALLKRGFAAGKDFQFYEEAKAGHNERAWAGRLDLCLVFLLRDLK